MSEIPTPRTDAMRVARNLGNITVDDPVPADFARRLERELAAEKTRGDTLAAHNAKLREVLECADKTLDDIDTASDAARPVYSTYSHYVMKKCVEGRDRRRQVLSASQNLK
jgi:hypothetical protein